MITPSFSPTATERVLPKLALDFTTANLDSRVTFTRATSASNPATYINSSGYITAATNNQPRFDYNLNTGGVCKGLLIEESRTNYLKYSSQFDITTAIWAFSNTSFAANQINSPDGTLTAPKLTGSQAYTPGTDTGSKMYYVSGGNPTTNINTPVTGSIYIYVSSAQNVQLGLFQWGGSAAFTEVAIPANTWTRATFTTTFASGSGQIGLAIYPGNSSIYMWGAQLEAGAFPTSYIPTTTTALTRNADVATMTGTNFSDWYNQSEGSILVEYSRPQPPSGTAPPIVYISDATLANRILIASRNASPVGENFESVGSGVPGARYAFASLGASNVPLKAVAAYKINSYAASLNANSPVTNSTWAPYSSMTQLSIGDPVAAASVRSVTVKRLFYYNQRLTNAEVQAFSK